MKKHLYSRALASVLTFAIIITCCAGISFAEFADIPRVETLIGNISSNYLQTTDDWQIVDVTAAGRSADLLNSESYKADAIERAYTSTEPGEIAKIGLALSNLGSDISSLTASGGEAFSISNKITEIGIDNMGYATTAMYALCALDAANYKGEFKEELLSYILSSRMPDGIWGYSWDGVNYADYDTTAVALSAFAPYYTADNAESAGVSGGVYTEILTAVDTIVEKLSNAWKTGEYISNANTDAMLIVGLSAVGVDPEEDSRFTGDNGGIVSSLLGFALEDNSGFGYLDNVELNSYATEQGLRALAAYNGFVQKSGAFSVYSYADVENVQTSTEPRPTVTPSEKPTDVRAITVSFQLIGDTIHYGKAHSGSYPIWISKTSVEISDGMSVGDLIAKMLDENEYTYKGVDAGYLSSVTSPSGITLEEKTNGAYSGWMYLVNNKTPDVGISDYKLKESDYVYVYYTDNYTAAYNPSGPSYDNEPSGGGTSGGSIGGLPGGIITGGSGSTPTPAPAATAKPQISFSDVPEAHWAYNAIISAAEKGVVSGYNDGSFKPDDYVTRAECITMIKNAGFSGNNQSAETHEFTDVLNSHWAYDAIFWGAENGIISGYDDGTFKPDEFVSRAECIAMLLRTGAIGDAPENIQIRFTDVLDDFWAYNEILHAASAEIIKGYEDGSFKPNDLITRAECVTVIENTYKVL